MSPVCAKCKKSIATALVECVCKRTFHPGCVKSYSVNKYADACCKSLSSSLSLPLTPVADNNTSFIFNTAGMSASVSDDARSLPRSQVVVETSMSHASIGELLLKLSDQLKESEARFTVFADEQRRTNCELNDKLNQLNSIASNVERNSQRIAALEHQCTALANEVRSLKSNIGLHPINLIIRLSFPASQLQCPLPQWLVLATCSRLSKSLNCRATFWMQELFARLNL